MLGRFLGVELHEAARGRPEGHEQDRAAVEARRPHQKVRHAVLVPVGDALHGCAEACARTVQARHAERTRGDRRVTCHGALDVEFDDRDLSEGSVIRRDGKVVQAIGVEVSCLYRPELDMW